MPPQGQPGCCSRVMRLALLFVAQLQPIARNMPRNSRETWAYGGLVGVTRVFAEEEAVSRVLASRLRLAMVWTPLPDDHLALFDIPTDYCRALNVHREDVKGEPVRLQS